jgi:hypothetical protein
MIKSNPGLKSFFSDRVLLAAVVFGFALRSISLLTKGQFDVDQMIFWGESISSKGWARGYLGVYFPTSHLFFNAVVEFSSLFQLNSFTVFTILRFFSETIFLFCLIYLLISNYVSRKYFILLWLNPLLLVLILSGYTDTFSISLIFLFLTLCLKSFMSFRSQLSLFVFVITGFVLCFFAFLKPQTLLLTATVLFFICLTKILIFLEFSNTYFYVYNLPKSKTILTSIFILFVFFSKDITFIFYIPNPSCSTSPYPQSHSPPTF